MIVALLWLTVSTPFVYAAQQQLEKYAKITNHATEDVPDSEDTPMGSTTEEKTETGINNLSEYLHTIDELSQLDPLSQKHNCHHDVAVYVAFHGETLCPPPNFIYS